MTSTLATPAPAAPAAPALAPLPRRLAPTPGSEQLGPYYSRPESFPLGTTDLLADMPGYSGPTHTIQGTVRSTDGSVIAGARVEAWVVLPNGEYALDAGRGAMLTGSDGGFEFTGPFPVAYKGRPSHWHLRVVTPEGAREHIGVVTQHYPAAAELRAGQVDTMQVVLEPGSRDCDRVAGPWFPRGPFDPTTGWVLPSAKVPAYVVAEPVAREAASDSGPRYA